MSQVSKDQKDKSQTFLGKLTSYLKLSSSEEPIKDDDETKADDEEEVTESKEEEKDKEVADDESVNSEESTDDEAESEDAEEAEEDDDKEDDIEEIDEDDSVEVDGKPVNLKDTASTRKAIERLKKKVSKQGSLLAEAKGTIEANIVAMNKTSEEVKNEIKSDFTPEGSKRSAKAKVENAIPDFLKPAPGSLAANAMSKAKATR